MTVMNPARVPFARAVLNAILADPDSHSQKYFGVKTECGTTMCIAGQAVYLDPDTEVRWFSHDMDSRVIVRGENVEIEDRAAHLLGVERSDAWALFFNFDDDAAIDTLRKWIEDAEAAA